MQIQINTTVKASWQEVKEGFDEKLFLNLNPPIPKVKLLRFDGCQRGDVVKMELNFLFWKDIWQSDITLDKETEEGFMFIDEGVKLPFPFKAWKHEHIVVKKERGSLIADKITYKTLNPVLDFFLYPFLYLQFLYRKPIYKRVFDKS